jgi:ATP-dependent Clp protease ATP-binding subunit ClpA
LIYKHGGFNISFFGVCIDEKVEATRKVIQQKLDTYISRAEQLKKELSEGQQPKLLSASSAVDSSNTSAGESSPNDSNKPKTAWSISRESTVGLEGKLRESVVGQSFAIRSVLAAVHRWASGWVDPQRPLVWLFVGPSGVGKTELSKALATALFSDDKNAMIRVDMSEYQDKSMVNKVRCGFSYLVLERYLNIISSFMILKFSFSELHQDTLGLEKVEPW